MMSLSNRLRCVFHLLSPQVMDMRLIESQVLQEETASEQGSVVGGHTETGRRAMAPPHAGAANPDASPMYSFNLSFEELSNVGLEETARHGNMQWMVNKPIFAQKFIQFDSKGGFFFVFQVFKTFYCK